jgi:hypothetical protein
MTGTCRHPVSRIPYPVACIRIASRLNQVTLPDWDQA